MFSCQLPQTPSEQAVDHETLGGRYEDVEVQAEKKGGISYIYIYYVIYRFYRYRF